jgi:hypothetical protein
VCSNFWHHKHCIGFAMYSQTDVLSYLGSIELGRVETSEVRNRV